MKTTVNLSDFRDAFKRLRPENFTYDGLEALYDWLIDIEECEGEELELDVIALCCDYSEYGDLSEFQQNYSEDYACIEDIEQETTVIRIESDKGFIIQDF